MSKSTPINQLPTNANGMNELMLDEDDDDAVREVLSQYQSPQNPSQQQYQTQYQQEIPQPTLMAQMPPQQMYIPQQIAPVMQHPTSLELLRNQYGSKSKFTIDFDFKTVAIVVAIVVFVQIFPVEKFVYNYISIEHIPYSSVLLKGLLAGCIFIIFTKYV